MPRRRTVGGGVAGASAERPSASVTARPAPGGQRLAITYVDLDTVAAWPMNPRDHDIGAIAASVLRFGFRDPLAVNRRNNEIEEGHGRVGTLLALRQQRQAAPPFVEIDGDGRWLVPVMYFDDEPETQHGYAIAHNRTQDLGGGWDTEKLSEILVGLNDLTGVGFDGEDLDDLVRGLARDRDGDDADGAQNFQVVVTCRSAFQQSQLADRLRGEGWDVEERAAPHGRAVRVSRRTPSP